MNPSNPPGAFVDELRTNAKGLNCMYVVEQLLSDPRRELEEVLGGIARAIQQAWQYPDACQVEILYRDTVVRTEGFEESKWTMRRVLTGLKESIGRITVAYREDMLAEMSHPFLDEEEQLLDIIADRFVHYLRYRKLRLMYGEEAPGRAQEPREWEVALQFLQRTDPQLLERITRKTINHLCMMGVADARRLLAEVTSVGFEETTGEVNQPSRSGALSSAAQLARVTFELGARHLPEEALLLRLQRGIYRDKAQHLLRPMTQSHSTLREIAEALARFRNLRRDKLELSEASQNSLIVNLLRRFFTEQLEFINVAKKHLRVEDFFGILDTLIYTPDGRGKLGGKSAGLFVAGQILDSQPRETGQTFEILRPKTWYLASDGILEFIKLNNLEEVYEQKYKSLDEVRQEYPHIVQVFKTSQFPVEIEHGLVRALDEFGDVPLIVRSSSLLEDRFSASFSGKYKSLFLANCGTRAERLAALKDAISEVYASIFAPDPIEYRAVRGLLDFEEEMGIMIQEVIGKRVGTFFFPAYAGVAFSNNELRWSPRIARGDGLVRLVPGLGTRAVDRLVDDYPVLAAPKQPGLRVNITDEERARYSPHYVDVIDLDAGAFKTLSLRELLQKVGDAYPAVNQVCSVVKHGRLAPLSRMLTDFAKEEIVATFDGLFKNSDFLQKVAYVLDTLNGALHTAVDIEFATDGERFYLLQCRPQSSSQAVEAAQIPANISENDVAFTANRFISNGLVPDLTHVVYVVPDAYQNLESAEAYLAVGEAVGKLNNLLPKRQFALVGPGRWGSRGDIKLGVRVTYADINNTAALIEVARKQGQYVPDLSFGTHFFQDLVESSIRYLPLYPDDPHVAFNESFFQESPNVLTDYIPEAVQLKDVVRVIEVPRVAEGRRLRILMNGDEDRAVGYFVDPAD